MRLLFVKLKHFGDALLLTPTLAAARGRLFSDMKRFWFEFAGF